MNYPTDRDSERAVDWATDKQALAEMIEQWGFESIRDAINQMRPDAKMFAFGYDDNSHYLQHRNDEF